MAIPEAPRFFEAMVLGRQWSELHHINLTYLRHLQYRSHSGISESDRGCYGHSHQRSGLETQKACVAR